MFYNSALHKSAIDIGALAYILHTAVTIRHFVTVSLRT